MSKERLVELIKRARALEQLDTLMGDPEVIADMSKGDEYLAEYLIENGVIILPCKMGDEVYWYNMGGTICEAEVVLVGFVAKTKGFEYDIDFNEIGKTVFLTREEAEAKLKESESNG